MGKLGSVLFGDSDKKVSREQLLFFLLLFSAVVGPGISYSNVYLFHLILAVNIIYLIISQYKKSYTDIKKLFLWKNRMNYFLFFSLLYFLCWIPFAENSFYAIKHFLLLSIGLSVVLLILIRVMNVTDFKFLYRSLAFIYLIDLFIGALEALQIFRWPVSRLSHYNHLFGRENQIEKILEESISNDYVQSMPTSFHWNPNNYSVFVLLGLPFFLLSKSLVKCLIGSAAILLLIVSSGSKSAFLGAIVIFFCSLTFIRVRAKNIFSFFLMLLFFSTNGFGTFSYRFTKMNEIQSFVYSGIGLMQPEEITGNINKSSSSYRMELINHALDILKENPIFGVGGGNAQHILEKHGGIGEKNIVNMHNFWLELLVEGGALYFLLLILWVLTIIIKYIKTIETKCFDDKIHYWAAAILLTLIGFVFSGIGPSSLIGYLPLYVLFGVALSLYYVLERKNDS